MSVLLAQVDAQRLAAIDRNTVHFKHRLCVHFAQLPRSVKITQHRVHAFVSLVLKTEERKKTFT
jgi:hypothetical protein